MTTAQFPYGCLLLVSYIIAYLSGWRDSGTSGRRDHDSPLKNTGVLSHSQAFSVVRGSVLLSAVANTRYITPAQKKTFQQSWKVFLCPG